MADELKQLLVERKAAWEQLSRLKKLASAGEVTEDQFKKLSAEYQERFQAADQRVASFKEGIRSKLSVLRPTLGAYEGQLKRLEQEYSEGKCDQRQYQARVLKVVEKRAQYAQKERLPVLEALLKAELPEHLDGLESATAAGSVSARPGRSVSGGSVWDMVLRGAGFIVAAGMVASVFVPFFATPLGSLAEEGNSLARATLLSSPNTRLGLLFAGVPVGLGIVVALISLVRGRGLRGALLLLLGTLACLGAAAAVAFVFSYPHPLLQQARSLLTDWGHARVGLPLVLGLLGALHVLALLHLFRSRTALTLWVSSLILALLAAGGTALFLHQWVKIEYSVSLKNRAGDAQAAPLEGEVENRGNVPLVIQEVLGNAPSLNQFALQVQRHSEVGWENTAAKWATEKGSLSGPESVAPAGMLHILVDPALPQGMSSVVFRVGLARPGTESRYSNEATIDLASKAKAEEVRKIVGELCIRLASMKAGTVLGAIQEARIAISQVSLEAEREKLNGTLDEAILEAKDREAGELYRRASEANQGGAHERAGQLAQDILDLYDKDPKSLTRELTKDESVLCGKAQEMVQKARRWADPTQRYTVTGIVEKGDGQRVGFLLDNATRQTLRVSPGDKVSDYSVQRITKKEIVLQRGGSTFELRR